MSNDFMDGIIAQLNQDVKKNNTNVFNNLQPPKEIPTYLNDPTIQHLVPQLPEKTNFVIQLTEIGQITKVYNRLRESGETGKLSDSFCDTSVKETGSRTARSFTKTIASYSRYISILQANNS